MQKLSPKKALTVCLLSVNLTVAVFMIYTNNCQVSLCKTERLERRLVLVAQTLKQFFRKHFYGMLVQQADARQTSMCEKYC